MTWTLMRKDLIQNARPLAFFFVAALLLPLAFTLFTRSEEDGGGYAGTVFGFLALGAPMLFGQWFIGQEKVKGTFRLLRSLPISGTRIIVTKYVGSTILCLVLIDVALFLEPLICRLIGLQIPAPAPALVVWTSIAAAFLVAVSIAMFTLLDTRIATQAIIWTMCGFMLCLALAGKYLQGLGIESLANRVVPSIYDLRAAIFVGLALGGTSFAIVWRTARVFEQREWMQLEEG